MSILTKEYIGLIIIIIITLFLFVGIFKAVFFSALITGVKYFIDKYLNDKINPPIEKFIKWLKGWISSLKK